LDWRSPLSSPIAGPLAWTGATRPLLSG
jgi:hypothetical protein